MLKMTIDNEEVVSKNDFTIKEEMLSASSTILNNTYPKSWEDDKDYTSRFYYPKDYAKLNIQNFSIEPEEAGTTIQVNGSATLTDVDTTKESRVQKLLGQTSQTTYSGKNKLKYAYPLGYSTEINGITWTINQDGTITANGTASSLSVFTFATGTEIADLIGQSVSFNGVPTGTDTQIFMGVYNQDWSAVKNIYGGEDKTFTIPSTATRVLARVYTGLTVNHITFKPMIRLSSVSDSTYEPYVGGIPSPNPQFPEPVNVVSGDNEINICGKNLLPYSEPFNENKNGCILTGSNGTYTLQNTPSGGSATSTKTDLISTYTIKNGDYLHMMNDKVSPNVAFNLIFTDNTSTNPTLNVKNRIFSLANYVGKTINAMNIYANTLYTGEKITLTPMIINSSTATTYEPYIGNTYPIYLGVENLLPKPLSSSSSSGAGNITLTWNTNNEYKLSGNATSNAYIIAGNLANDYTIKNGDYLHLCNDSIPSGIIQIVGISSSSTQIFASTIGTKNKILDLSSYNGSILRYLRFYCVSGASVDMKCTPMILNGISKETSYSEYGVQPIELCKIGTYQDSIYKGVGSNLLDSLIQGTINTSTGEFETNPNTEFRVSENYIKVDSNKIGVSYITSGTKQIVLFEYKSDYTYITYQAESSNSNLFTLNSETKYIKIRLRGSGVSTTDITNAIVSNDSVLPYEPYNSKDKWLLHKEIGKVVLDGSESWIRGARSDNTTHFYQSTLSNINLGNTTLANELSNYFKLANPYTDNSDSFWLYKSGTTEIARIGFSDETIDTTAKLQTWLSTHNTIVYYVLATPTTTEITDTTLISQLDALESQ